MRKLIVLVMVIAATAVFAGSALAGEHGDVGGIGTGRMAAFK